ncbi:MAG TPA: NUDIX domain-containing protein [Patescibacteria group bacterium]
MENQTIKVGVNVILEKDNKVLLGKRKNITGDGYWGFPSGHLEFNETLADGAKRELLEETGLVVDELNYSGVINQPRQDTKQHYIQFVFVSKKFHGELENKEPDKCEKWEWFDIKNLPENIFFAHKHFLDIYLNKQLLIDPQIY